MRRYYSDFPSSFFSSGGSSASGAVSSITSSRVAAATATTSSKSVGSISYLSDIPRSATFMLSPTLSSFERSTSKLSTRCSGRHFTSMCLSTSSMSAHSSIFALEVPTNTNGIFACTFSPFTIA